MRILRMTSAPATILCDSRVKLNYTWGDQPDYLKKKMNNYQGDFPYKNDNRDGYMVTSPVGSNMTKQSECLKLTWV